MGRSRTVRDGQLVEFKPILVLSPTGLLRTIVEDEASPHAQRCEVRQRRQQSMQDVESEGRGHGSSIGCMGSKVSLKTELPDICRDCPPRARFSRIFDNVEEVRHGIAVGPQLDNDVLEKVFAAGRKPSRTDKRAGR